MGRNKTVHRNPVYIDWIKRADQLYLMQKKGLGPVTQMTGPFVAVLELNSTNRRRKDCDNFTKVVLDFCSRLGLIEDDRHAQWVIVGWTPDPAKAPYGALLTLLECKKEGLPEILAGLTESLAEKPLGETEGQQ